MIPAKKEPSSSCKQILKPLRISGSWMIRASAGNKHHDISCFGNFCSIGLVRAALTSVLSLTIWETFYQLALPLHKPICLCGVDLSLPRIIQSSRASSKVFTPTSQQQWGRTSIRTSQDQPCRTQFLPNVPFGTSQI
jgi:hypothetical protein